MISIPKTEYMALGRCVVGAATQEDYAEQVWKHVCSDCGRGFPTKHGLAVHRGRNCRLAGREEYEVEKVVGVRGVPAERFYLVRWKGWAEQDDSWINWRQLDAQDAVDDFWEGAALDRSRAVWEDAEEGLRCRQCCKLFGRQQDLKAHHTKRACAWRVASRVGSKAERAVLRQKMAEAHKDKGYVKLGEKRLKAAFVFKYLGIEFAADGDRKVGLEIRMEKAADRFRQLGSIWHSASLSVKVKLRLYVAGVASVLVYGSECWDLADSTCSAVRAWNARRLATLTGRSINV